MTMIYMPAQPDHVTDLSKIADATLFPGDMLPELIAPFLEGAQDQLWITALRDGVPVGLSFTRAEELADAVWNMKALAVSPALHRSGVGQGLVRATEDAVREMGGRLLVVDTSSDVAQIPAVAFYQSVGYRIEGVVRDFWAEGEDRISLAKRL
ncbi:GNAT family N-acetyltransferase [Gymnodinialimonas hymeniacidonis]|uniref:GNAT family N-acetyltransferase n=1 Tax=Gymnodinialimonas hymeniacidonis TaxID=3126508 RepID=UPI0034C5DF2E